jgi:Fe-S-cluster containining protein
LLIHYLTCGKRKRLMKKCDPDKPSTWMKYRDGLCQNCWAGCCTMPLEVSAQDLIDMRLTHEDEAGESLKKLAKRLQKEGIIQSYRANTGVFMISQKSNGDCYFLDSKTRLCTIYEKRPTVCREFPTKLGFRLGYCPAGKKD